MTACAVHGANACLSPENSFPSAALDIPSTSFSGGFINVGANTGMMKNTEIAQKLNEEAKMLLSQTMKLHDSISQLMA